MGIISTSLFQTKYKNFIDLIFKDEKNFTLFIRFSSFPFSVYQNIKTDIALVKGIEINSKVFLGIISKFIDGFILSYKYNYQKGIMNSNIPMNVFQL